jgi:hypothetical protein
MRVVNGIREMLRFETKPALPAGLQLHAGFVCADFHDQPALWLA